MASYVAVDKMDTLVIFARIERRPARFSSATARVQTTLAKCGLGRRLEGATTRLLADGRRPKRRRSLAAATTDGRCSTTCSGGYLTRSRRASQYDRNWSDCELKLVVPFVPPDEQNERLGSSTSSSSHRHRAGGHGAVAWPLSRLALPEAGCRIAQCLAALSARVCWTLATS
jgi:hypothetical protein